MSEKSLVWKVVQLEQEVERLTLQAHEAAQRQADAVGKALAVQEEEIERLHKALEKIANTPQLKGCCNKWEHCDCLDIANDLAREALGGER